MAQARKRDAPLLPAYLVVGADELKRETVVRRLKARLEPGLEAFNLDERTVTADLVPQDLLASLDTMPLGAGPRLVIVHVPDPRHLPKALSDALASYLGNPNPATTLCLEAESMDRRGRLYKALAKVGPQAVIDCAPPRGRQLVPYLVRHARAMGTTLDGDAARGLVERVGEDTTSLDRQLRTLAEVCRAMGRITLGDVEEHVARTAEVKPWHVIDAICARDAGRALELYRLMGASSDIGLLVLLERRIRELVCARSLDARGEGGRLAEALGLSPREAWRVKSHRGWARGFRDGELERALAECARCERTLKGGGDAEGAMVSLILSVCLPS